MKFRICTFNIRGFFDHYNDRKMLLANSLHEIKPDILCLQEVMINGAGQDTFIKRCLSKKHQYNSDLSIFKCLYEQKRLKRFSYFVNAILFTFINILYVLLLFPILNHVLSKIPLLCERIRIMMFHICKIDILPIYKILYAPIWGISTFYTTDKFSFTKKDTISLTTELHDEHLAIAQRTVLVQSKSSRNPFIIWVINVHLESMTDRGLGKQIRQAEIVKVLNWINELEKKENVDAIFIAGDFNTLLRNEYVLPELERKGYISTYYHVHGKNPEKTWPSGIRNNPFYDQDGVANCLDYICVKTNGSCKLEIINSKLGATEPSVDDPNLYASDHFALYTDIKLTR